MGEGLEIVVEAGAGGREPIVLPVSGASAAREPAAIGDTGYTLRVIERFERLRLDERNRPIEDATGPPNEAVVVELRAPDGATDKRWLFARGPLPEVGGRLALPFALRLRAPSAEAPADSALPPSSLAVLEAPGIAPVRVVTGLDRTRDVAPLVLGAPIRLSWFDEIEARVVDRWERTRVTEEAFTEGYADRNPAVRVRLEGPSGSETRWVVSGAPRSRGTAFRGGAVRVRYGPELFPLGFTVTLKDFVLRTYEGTSNPMSFESFVRVRPHDGRPAFDYHIYMNHVMDFGGWRFFQSAYDPHTLRRSIFAVTYDPGKHIVYAGYLLTPLGLLFIVFVKPWLLRREAARRAAAGVARTRADAAAATSAEGGAPRPDVGAEAEA